MPKHGMKRFDPHDHLISQGWKGKGTALKQGHATRPIPVVQKKSMSGIGKDRDEAIPFWDHIFASTAASLASAATSGASTPTTVEPPKPTLSIAARSSREIARRKLYSGFFRSTPKSQQHTPKWESDETGESEVEAAVVEEVVATSPEKGLTEEVTPAETKKEDKIKKREEKEAEKKAKKAEKEAKRAEKEAKRAKKEAKRAKKSNPKPATESTPNELEPAELSTGPSVEGEAGESKEERRVRRDARRLEKAEKAAARDAKNAERGDKEARRTRRKEEEKMKEHKREGKKARKSNA